MWLTGFRDRLEAALHGLLWRQWTRLGVQGASEGAAVNTPIDPEALVLFTLESARTEPQLFDEALDWLLANGGAIDVQRLRNIVRRDADYPVGLLAAVASLLSSRESSAKWRRLALIDSKEKPEPLFILRNDAPAPPLRARDEHFEKAGYLRSPFRPRGLTRPVPVGTPATLRFQLRGLFGIGIRAESIAFLLTHDDGHANEVAEAGCYSFPGARQILSEMASSKVVRTRRQGREKRYWLEKDRWWDFLMGGHRGFEPTGPAFCGRSLAPGSPLRWVNWVRCFRALAAILRFARRRDLEGATDYVQGSEFGRVLERANDDLGVWSREFGVQGDRGDPILKIIDSL